MNRSLKDALLIYNPYTKTAQKLKGLYITLKHNTIRLHTFISIFMEKDFIFLK